MTGRFGSIFSNDAGPAESARNGGAALTGDRNSMFLFWMKTVAVGLASIFFLALGIDNLVSAYSLNHPHMFILSFFSSSLMILISLSGLLFSCFRILTFIQGGGKDHP